VSSVLICSSGFEGRKGESDIDKDGDITCFKN
jgi:hypothetical protein